MGTSNPVQIGQYQIISSLGIGGMGKVYEVRHASFKKDRYALKVLHDEFASSEAARDRFEQEALVMRELGELSEHVLPVLDFRKEDEGLSWMLMPLIKGIKIPGHGTRVVTLRDWLNATDRLPFRESVKYLYQILDALTIAHDRSILHRGLKPENILLTDQGVLIADFGLARVAGQSMLSSGHKPTSHPTQGINGGNQDKNLTQENSGQTAAIIGTIAYLPPEIRPPKTGENSIQADLYAVGLMAVEMLTGTKELGLGVVPSEVRDCLSPGWDRWLAKAVAPKPKDRFESAREMYRALAQVIERDNCEQNEKCLTSPLPPEPPPPPPSVVRPTKSISIKNTAPTRKPKKRNSKQKSILTPLFIAAVILGCMFAAAIVFFDTSITDPSRINSLVTQLIASENDAALRRITTEIQALEANQNFKDEKLKTSYWATKLGETRQLINDAKYIETALIDAPAHDSPAQIGKIIAEIQRISEEATGSEIHNRGGNFFSLSDLGLTSGQMRIVQSRLNDFLLDHPKVSLSPLKLNGQMDGACQNRILWYQHQNGLAITGRPNLQLYRETKSNPPPPPTEVTMIGSNAGEEREFGGIVFRWCPPGEFTMGSPESEAGRSDRETRKKVEIKDGFWLAKYECTQSQWEKFLRDNPSKTKGADLPVESVNWYDVQYFLGYLNGEDYLEREWIFTLPTEAQWEYACRAGTSTAYYFGDSAEQLHLYENFLDQTKKNQVPGASAKAGSYLPNPWGFHDMLGNVCEWCSDGLNTPKGPVRAVRGGGWGLEAKYCRSAMRNSHYPTTRFHGNGFRLAIVQAKNPLLEEKLSYFQKHTPLYRLRCNGQLDPGSYEFTRLASKKWPTEKTFALRLNQLSEDNQVRLQALDMANSSGVTVQYSETGKSLTLATGETKEIPIPYGELQSAPLDKPFFVKEGNPFTLDRSPDRYRLIATGQYAAIVSCEHLSGLLETTILYSPNADSTTPLFSDREVSTIQSLLVGKTEVGEIIEASESDIGKSGDHYEIDYLPDGTMKIRINGGSLSGYYTIKDSTICRALELEDEKNHFHIIFDIGDGNFEAHEANTGTVRYRFTIK